MLTSCSTIRRVFMRAPRRIGTASHNTGWTPAASRTSASFRKTFLRAYRILHRHAALQVGILNLSGGG